MTDESAGSSVPEIQPSPQIDTTVPHSARVWNYWLGGQDNYPVDREAGDQFCEVYPGIVDVARVARYFLARAVRHLAGEAGVRQFLDVGTGLPTVDNTHEVAQRAAPESRIVYVDNDPLVLSHARALLTSTPEGMTDYVDADLREPDRILAAAAGKLDFTRPVALMLMGILGHLPDEEEPKAIIDRLMGGLAPGSYLVLYDSTSASEANAKALEGYNDSGAVPYRLRSPEQVAHFFDGLELLEPGVVPLQWWRPDVAHIETTFEVNSFGGIGRK
ncbi:SAM-dependent methyltransferase [Actinomadura sp. 1N219]|uniref:SAM-dependent methyltransferase n=1 Tax=Actinomadura sp. 1N219 TaxID=3375152 RepID=UPI0037BA0BCA